MILIIGKRGSGKTTLSKKLINEHLIKNDKLIIIDINNQYSSFDYVDITSLIAKNLYNCRIVLYPEYLDAFFTYMSVIKNRIIIFDEIDFFNTINNKSFDRFLINSRINNNDIIATARRPKNISTTFISQLDYLYSFKVYYPNDLKYISQFIGQEETDKLPELKKYRYIKHSFI